MSISFHLLISRIIILIFYYSFWGMWSTNCIAQSRPEELPIHNKLYDSAFYEILQMLEGKKSINFKRAVFLIENAFLKGQLSYEKYDGQIRSVAEKLRQMITEKGIERFKTAGNWAVFTYMTDSIAQNNFKPYLYDFENFLPDKDPTVGFVSKLLKTGKGNCNSLPELYKILAEEIGAEAYLSLAPIHSYIKHKDENGKWVNLEMTSGSFARDEWIMQQTGITAEQIKSGIYMNALSQHESLALILKELAANYQFQFGIDEFDLKVIDAGLKYFPTGINLYMVKFEHYRKKLLLARKYNDLELEKQVNSILNSIDQKLIDLAYKEVSTQDYEQWIKANENSATIGKPKSIPANQLKKIPKE